MNTTPAGTAGETAYRGPGGAVYLNITNRCSAACTFCLREWTHDVYGANLRLTAEPAADGVVAAVAAELDNLPAPEIVFCGLGEPTMRLDAVLQITAWLHERKVPVRLNTNGHGGLLNPGQDVPADLAAAGLTAVAVSLNAADEITYQRLCRPRLPGAYRAMLAFAEQCMGHGIATSLSVINHPDVDVPACAALAAHMGAAFRVRALALPTRWDEEERA
jgi:TatD family-associated radical SAM protein